MHPELEKAMTAVKNEGCTCALTLGNVIFKSKDKSVRSLLDWMNSGNNYMGYMLADKIVGKAAAFIMIAMGIREIYAQVISEPAKALLEKEHVVVNADLVEILDKDKAEKDPLERAVESYENAAEALMPIELALIRLNL